MRIDSLHLESFRGFEALDLDFNPSFTLLLGENGAGKTAVLEALSVALGALFLGLLGTTVRPLTRDDVRHKLYEHAGLLDLQPQWPVLVSAKGTLAGKTLTWTRTLKGEDGRTTRVGAAELRRTTEELARSVKAGNPRLLPLIAYYGTQRLWLQKKVTGAKRGVGSRYDGYIDGLDPASNQRLLTEWMYQQTLVELQRREQVPQLRAVERAVCECIAGATRFYFDVSTQDLQLERTGGERMPFSLLSDGYRNLVAMVADIAWRASVLNPHLGHLTGWQATPNASWESIPGADKEEVRDALLRDQGRLCAYCQRRIPSRDERMKVEHWRPQAACEGELRWSNLLGVCLGDEAAETGSTRGERHCDTARGDATRFLHPVDGQGPDPREYLRYTAEGEARPSGEEPARAASVASDIGALNLNARRLRRARVEVYEAIKQRLDKAGWSEGSLRAEHRAASIHPGARALPQCEVVRYHLRRWARQKNNVAL